MKSLTANHKSQITKRYPALTRILFYIPGVSAFPAPKWLFSTTSVVIQRGVPLNDNLELEMSNRWPQKRENKIGNFITIVLIKGTLAWAK